MGNENNEAWERLLKVITMSGLNVNAFSRKLGLRRSQNLYEIRRGNNRISQDLARRINEHYPIFSRAWLLIGEEEPISSDTLPELLAGTIQESAVVRIPVYHDLLKRPLFHFDNPDEYLLLSTAQANDAEFAVTYHDETINPYLRKSLLLLRRHNGEILYGSLYLVVTHVRRFCFVHSDLKPENLCLEPLSSSGCNEILIRHDSIRSLWFVCGAVCHF